MISRSGKLLRYLLAVAAGEAFYFFILSLFRQDALNRFGYILWLVESSEDRMNFLRLTAFQGYFLLVVPLLVAMACVGLVRLRFKEQPEK